MSYGASLVSLIDGRIDAAQVKPTKMGTVIDRSTTGARATVSLDGSSGIPQPVKCFETVVIDVGDRVGLIRFEGEWIIVGNYTLRTLGDALTCVNIVSTASTTSATLVDMPTSPSATIFKYRDTTQLQIIVAPSLYCTTATIVVEIGVNITFPDGTTSAIVLYRKALNSVNLHQDLYGGTQTAGTYPAGQYVATAQWRRLSGTGTATIDVNDSVTVHLKEVVV